MKSLEEQKRKDDSKKQIFMYARVGNIEQLDYYIKEEIKDRNDKNVVGLYIRSGCMDDDGLRANIYTQTHKLEEYCKSNNITNFIKYIDINKSAKADDRLAFKRMIADIDKGIINKVIVTSTSRLFRDIIKLSNFEEYSKAKNIDVISLDIGLIFDEYRDWRDNEYSEKKMNDEKDGFDKDLDY